MRVDVSYAVRVARADSSRPDGLTRAESAVLESTVAVYRAALSFLVTVVDERWGEVEPLASKSRVNHVERLVHATAKNPAPDYPEFDRDFYKMPSYLRRAAVQEAVGAVSSYRSNLANWEEGGRKGARPRLGKARFAFPALYKGGMRSAVDVRARTMRVKAFDGRDWAWMVLPLKASDVDYLARRFDAGQVKNPALERKGKRWRLRFCCRVESELVQEPPETMRACGVDLGLGACAAMCAMECDGTVVGRRVFDLPAEKDRLAHAYNKVRKAQQEWSGHKLGGGGARMPRLWGRVNGINADIARRTARAVVDFAAEYSCDVIVLENLSGLSGGKRGLSLWRKREVARAVAVQAHLLGMRVRTVCAWGTSRLAFDGSGRVYRGPRELDQAVKDGVIAKAERAAFDRKHKGRTVATRRTCLFRTGKRYDADLNASYNIAARFYVREQLKSLPATARLDAEAKVPSCSKGTTVTLSTLFDLRAVLRGLGLEVPEPRPYPQRGSLAA